MLLTRGPDRVSPFSIPSIIPNMGAGWVSIELGTKGPLMSECTACAASNMAIGDAMDEIRLGRADVMFAGGTEAPITQVGIAGFDAMRALSRRNDDPVRASRPFDRDRDGLVMGEAAAVVLLEELEHAKARGAKIYAELVGYGISSDASHMTEPDPTGENPARAMTMALADAGVDPTEVGYVNAHATSTPLGDSAETRVIKRAFGEEHATTKLAVSSTKGATGHCFGAAGAVEAVFTVLAIADRKARRRSTTRARSGLRPRLRPECRARSAGSGRRGLELVRLRRPQRLDRRPPLRGLAPRKGGARHRHGGGATVIPPYLTCAIAARCARNGARHRYKRCDD